MKTENNSPGSFYVGQNLPEKYKKTGKVENSSLAILIAGEDKPRSVSFIMGSQQKGWFLTAKGSGPLPVGPVEYEVLEESARVVVDDETTRPPMSRH